MQIQEDSLHNFRQEASAEDAYTGFLFLETSPLAKRYAKMDAFPVSPARTFSNIYFRPTSFEVEVSIQAVRFKLFEEKITQAFYDLNDINNLILNAKWDELADALTEYNTQYGASLVLLKKCCSVRCLDFDSAKLLFALEAIIQPWSKPHPTVVSAMIKESLNREENYIDVRRRFLSYVQKEYVNEKDKHIIIDFLDPTRGQKSSFQERLHAYSTVSCLDALHYLMTLKTHDRLKEKYLTDSVLKAWSVLSQKSNIEKIAPLLGSSEKISDYTFLRHLSSWRELESVNKHQLLTEKLMSKRLNGTFGLTTESVEVFHEDSDAPTFPLIVDNSPRVKHNSQFIKLESISVWYNTISLLQLYSKGYVVSDLAGEDLLKLLDNTVDISRIMAPEEVLAFFPNKTMDLLYSYLREAIVSGAVRSETSEFRFRKALQNIVIRQFESDIIKFIEFLNASGERVAEHLFEHANEFFLSQLFILYETPNQFIEARAQLLEWDASKNNSDISLELAKALRVDLQLNRVRDDIDDNRIYVDPIRYQYYLLKHVVKDMMTAVKRNPLGIATNKPVRDIRNPIEVIKNPQLELPKILEKAYLEFCKNKQYGVDSYIGRRIRHGTLEGNMLARIRAVVETAEEELSYTEPVFVNYLNSWLAKYIETIDYIGDELLQVRCDDKPKGCIDASIISTPKSNVVSNALGNIYEQCLLDSSLASIAYVVSLHCWRILEVDLAEAREAISNVRTSSLILDATEMHSTINPHNLDKINKICAHLNSEISKRFDKLIGWLKRPNNLSPTALLTELFDATVIEVKDHYTDFDPLIEKSGQTEFFIQGHRYHYFYDVMEILVANAAKHGHKSGELFLNLESIPHETLTGVKLTIKSSLSDDANEVEVAARIREAMNADVDNAMVTEGFTGIRKIRSMVVNVDELNGFDCQVVNGSIVATLQAFMNSLA